MEREEVYVDEEVSFRPSRTEIDVDERRHSDEGCDRDPSGQSQDSLWEEVQSLKQQMRSITVALGKVVKMLESPRSNENGNSAYPVGNRLSNSTTPGESTRDGFADRGDRQRSTLSHRPRDRSRAPVKFPPFTGKESWKVWINRFEAIAERQGWDEDIMLDHLLPKLEGEAGEFAYVQLPSSALHHYGRLVEELDSRYRVIETTKTFASKFARRVQKAGEMAEEFAADLKRLYDRAHPGRDRITRQEDLVRKFLDGLRDDEARFEIEFHKEPRDIDEAVYQAVNFIQTKRGIQPERPEEKRERRYVRCIRVEDDDADPQSEGGESEALRRVPTVSAKKKSEGGGDEQQKESNQITLQESEREILLKLMSKVEQLAEQSEERERRSNGQKGEKKQVTCFGCGRVGHFVRNCRYNQAPAANGYAQSSYSGAGYDQRPPAENWNYRGPGHPGEETTRRDEDRRDGTGSYHQ